MIFNLRNTVLLGPVLLLIAVCASCAPKVTSSSKTPLPGSKSVRTPAKAKLKAKIADSASKRVKIQSIPGYAVFALTPDKAPEGKPDFYMADLSTEKTTLITSGALFPSDFTSEPMSIALSPNAQYMAAVSAVGGYNQLWVWKIGERPRRVCSKKGMTLSTACWSPSSRYILFNYTGYLRAYDVKLRKIIDLGEIDCATWSARKDIALLVVPAGHGCVVTAVDPATMRKNKVFAWKNVIQSIAQSPNGSDFIIDDAERVYFRANGKWHRSKPKTEDYGGAEFSYNQSGSQVAISGSFASGEPHIRLNSALWCADRTGRNLKLLGSSDNEFTLLLNTGDSYSIDFLVGWTSDSKYIVLASQYTISTNGDDIASRRHDEFSLGTIGCRKRYKDGKLAFESGPGCLGFCYLARKVSR